MTSPNRIKQRNPKECGFLRCLRWANPITTGILLYIAIFQWTSNNWSSCDQSDKTDVHVGGGLSNSVNPAQSRRNSVDEKLYDHLVRDDVVVPIKPWRRFSDRDLKVPFPIFQTSLSKSGTTSLFKYLKCGGFQASHQYITKSVGEKSSLTGECIEENILRGLPPFQGCGEYDIFTDTGYLKYAHDEGEHCYYPSIDGLGEIYRHYPNSTFINIVRETPAWYKSLQDWAKASVFVRMRLCNASHFPNGQTNKQGWYDFYDWHNAMVRQFAEDHPSLTYVEVRLEDPKLGNILEEKIGVESKCWKNCRPQNRQCDEDMQKDKQ